MAERSYPLQLQAVHRVSSPHGGRKVRLKEKDVTEEQEEIDCKDSPEELLLPREHCSQITREAMLRKWLHSNPDTFVREEEDNEDEEQDEECLIKEGNVFSRIKVTGSCLCKLFVIIYLLACLLVSALYIAIYGPNELYLIPEGPNKIPLKPSPDELSHLQFYDNLYTEWISDRWTYDFDPFSDWPTLPDYILDVHQIVSGQVDNKKGIWLLDPEGLYFVYGFESGNTDDVSFVNISENLDISVHENSQVSLRSHDSLFLISPDNITMLDCSPSAVDYCDLISHWPAPDFSTINSAVVSGKDGHLWIGTDDGLYMLNTSVYANDNRTAISLISDIEGSVISLSWRSGLLGPKGWGLQSNAFLLTNTSYLHPQDVSFNTGSDIYIGDRDSNCFGLLAIGTTDRIYFYDGDMIWFEWVSIWENGLGGVVDGPPITMTFAPTGDLYIGNNVSLTRLNINYTFDRIGPSEGLPYNQITSLHYSNYTPRYPPPMAPPSDLPHSSLGGTLFVGSQKGWSLFDIVKSEFIGYFYGPRWHPGEEVLGIAAAGFNMSVVLTDKGFATVRPEDWTLEKKALHYQNMLKRHTREPGLVSDCPLQDFVPLSCNPEPTDNDGLWTSWLVAAEAFRYKVTQNESARLNAMAFYEGMKFLVDVTGISGLPARSVMKYNDTGKHDIPLASINITSATEGSGMFPRSIGEEIGSGDLDEESGSTWHPSTSFPDWQWKGDTSSDEIVGHIFANAIAFDLVAKTIKEKQEVMHTLDSIIGYIKNNNYTLIDVTNRTTHWGVWSPSVLNFNQSWADEHGLNSLEILTGLLTAFWMTGKTTYLEGWQELYNGSTDGVFNHFGLNMINQKITFPRDINYSDDELAFLPYFSYFFSLKHLAARDKRFEQPEMWNIPLLSLKRAWKYVGKERSAAWTSIYGYITGEIDNVELTSDIVWSLRHWPLELVQWRTQNSHRLDIRFNSEQDRNFRSRSQSTRVLPPNERTQLRWSGNPYQLDWGGSNNEMDPGPWLMSYWLARWAKLL